MQIMYLCIVYNIRDRETVSSKYVFAIIATLGEPLDHRFLNKYI